MAEKMWIEEYEKIAAKDQGKGKDNNQLAYEQLKRAKYFFD